MHICIIGAGAIGTFLAARLASCAQITMVDRRATSFTTVPVEVTGILECQEQITTGPNVVNADFFMVTTKATHLRAVLDDLVNFRTPVAFWQNGIGVNHLAQQRLPDTSIIRALIWAGVNYESPGIVKCNGFSRIALATLQGDVVLQTLADCLAKAGLKTVIVDNANLAEWEKSLWNIGVNALCAITRERNGATIDSPHLRELLVHLIREAQQVARAVGCDLDMEESVIRMIRTTAANINSMLRDVQMGRLTEIEHLNGSVIRLGSRLGIETPYNTFAYHLIKHFESKHTTTDLEQLAN